MTDLSRFRHILAGCDPREFHAAAPSNPRLLIPESSSTALRTYYSPFDHVNHEAELILVGITPGREQMNNALLFVTQALQNGHSDSDALALVKSKASFSGKMRRPLVELLDQYGLHRRFALRSCAELWNPRCRTAHFTSVLRNPVFTVRNGEEANYTGSSPALDTYKGFVGAARMLLAELQSVPRGLILPLGTKVTAVMQKMVDEGALPLSRVLNHGGAVAELPHPSGENFESLNLVTMATLMDKAQYIEEKWQTYLAKNGPKAKQTREQYSGKRTSYWLRAQQSRAALEMLGT